MFNERKQQIIDVGLFTALEQKEKIKELSRIARHFGFDYCDYAAYIYPPMSRPTVLELSNLPAQWKAIYTALSLEKIDPLLNYAHANNAPLRWCDALYAQLPPFWNEARQNGLAHGCTIPLWISHGSIGLISFCREAMPMDHDEFNEKIADLLWISHQLHTCMLAQPTLPTFYRARSQLSERERTILKWTADGKTSSELASILGLTQRTINFHIGRAAEKLNSTNKTQAALKAAVLGLLF